VTVRAHSLCTWACTVFSVVEKTDAPGAREWAGSEGQLPRWARAGEDDVRRAANDVADFNGEDGGFDQVESAVATGAASGSRGWL
jgi:hypothetical protein